ncbi:MAG TPA: glycosyltransferase family 2 protein [Ilumatobacter sp.]|nr:glycosyltransferase family 2 protein [Ilumatobacter sp.]
MHHTAVVGWPTVSVVMPVRNEAEGLAAAVAAVLTQDYPLAFDVCLAVAPSDDGTERIAAELAAADARVRVVPNPAGATPAGLNAAIAATTGDVVVRVDGHARLSPGYIRQAVTTLRATGAVNVGGVQAAVGETPFEQAVATAMTSLLGTGGSRFHVGGQPGPVDTVYLGVFDRAAGDAVGWFDERLIRNQDYELNIRLREAGGTVWFDPELSVTYRPRSTLRALAKQYYEYGWWKAEVLRQHPSSLKARQAAPAALPAVLAAAAVAGRWWRPAWLVPAGYAAAVAIGSKLNPRVVLATTTMHLAWGLGFALATVRAVSETVRSSRWAH